MSSYFYDKKTNRHFWSIKSTANNSKGTLCIFKNSEKLRGADVIGLLMVGKDESKISFYLQ